MNSYIALPAVMLAPGCQNLKKGVGNIELICAYHDLLWHFEIDVRKRTTAEEHVPRKPIEYWQSQTCAGEFHQGLLPRDRHKTTHPQSRSESSPEKISGVCAEHLCVLGFQKLRDHVRSERRQPHAGVQPSGRQRRDGPGSIAN